MIFLLSKQHQMNHDYFYQVFLVLLLLIPIISGRALYYDQLDEDGKMKSSSNEEEDVQDLNTKTANWVNNQGDNDQSYDSYEERQFHQRALFSTSRPSHTISTHTRQALIDILQKAFDQGWRPNMKHYIPATRFGRHRR